MHKLLFLALIIVSLSACKKEERSFSGYIDTDLVYLSSDFGGRLVDLAVLKGQHVKANQLLFKLEQTSELYHVEVSELTKQALVAQRQQILSQLHYNEINDRRITEMRKQNAASQSDLDAAQRDLMVSQQQLVAIDAKIKSNRVDIADKKWQVIRKENVAPEQGIIFDTYYAKGEFVQTGYPVLSLVTQNNIKAIFFVSEEQLAHVRLNEKVIIKTDQNENFATGHISYISNIAEYTPPVIYSREERHRLVFRIEAKVDAPDLEKIHLGQPVTLELS